MRFILLLQFIHLFQLINGQSLIIDDTITLKKGIYKNYEEFKYNRPSIDHIYNMTTKDRGYGFLASEGSVTFYKLDIEKEKGQEIGSVYGFCDGQNVYITGSKNVELSPKREFVKLDYLGRYCYFEAILSSTVYTGTSTVSTIDLYGRALDIIDGEIVTLSKKTLREILKNDTVLFNTFNSQKQKNKHLKKYLIEYSNTHYNDINLVKELELLNLESLMYNHLSDTTFSQYYERILNCSNDPQFIAIELRKRTTKNGQLKFIGLKSRHKRGNNEDYFYKIGTWRYFHKNGQLKEFINYDFQEDKHGLWIIYDETGAILKESTFIQGVEQ